MQLLRCSLSGLQADQSAPLCRLVTASTRSTIKLRKSEQGSENLCEVLCINICICDQLAGGSPRCGFEGAE